MRPIACMTCLLALWAAALVPTTCSGGLLAHACEGDADPVCHHEESCPADPCNIVSFAPTTTDKGRTDDDADVTPPLPVVHDDGGPVCGFAGAVRVPPPLPLTVVPLRC